MNPLEIKKIRKKLSLNQSEFGKILNVGLRSVQLWESGDRPISKKAKDLLNNYLKSNNTSHLFALSIDEMCIYIHDHLPEFENNKTFNMVVDGVIKNRLIKELEEKERIIEELKKRNKNFKG